LTSHNRTSKPTPTNKEPGKRRAQEIKAGKKVAEVIAPEGPSDEDTGNDITVSNAVLQRIRKALALGLHAGGNDVEKLHAMQRATRLMQQYGLSQAGARLVSLLCIFLVRDHIITSLPTCTHAVGDVIFSVVCSHCNAATTESCFDGCTSLPHCRVMTPWQPCTPKSLADQGEQRICSKL
jgi:hypothetical protein